MQVARRYAAALIVAILCVVALESAQPSPLHAKSSTMGATTWISPAVVATWFAERTAGGADQLQLLVLWRGAPAWFSAPGSLVRGSSNSTGDHLVNVSYGSVHLRLAFNPSNRKTSINDIPVDTLDANVVLVDDVDGPSGPRVVRTARLATAMPGSSSQIGLAIRTSPEVMAFLKCDATSSDASKQRLIAAQASCLQTLGVGR